MSEVFDESAVLSELRRIGARFDPEVLMATRALYRPAAECLFWCDRPAVSDIAYGPAERNRLDVYPADRRDAPVVLFLHGGGFIGGDKAGDPVFYGNVGRYFAAHGFLTVVPNYRLAPEFTWPSGLEDVAAVLSWISARARAHGGDPSRVVIVGQSAGAAHAAGHLFRGEGALLDPAIRGVALMSGFYHAKPPLLGGPLSYFGEDEALWRQRSPVAHVSKFHPPMLLSVAQFDPAPIADQTLDLAAAINRVDGCPPQILWFEGHNHVSTVHGLGLGSDTVGRALRAFVERVTE